MPLILGIYILTPLIANGIRSIDIHLLKLLLVFFSVYIFGSSFINTMFSISGQPAISPTLSLEFSGGTYGMYFLLGYAVKKDCLKKFRTIFLSITAVFSFISAVAFQMIAYHYRFQYNIWYNDLFLLFFSVSIFELGSRIQIKCPHLVRIIQFVSYYSFPVYLIHGMVNTILIPLFGQFDLVMSLKAALAFFAVYLCSLGCGLFIQCIPKLGNYILYIKPPAKNKIRCNTMERNSHGSI